MKPCTALLFALALALAAIAGRAQEPAPAPAAPAAAPAAAALPKPEIPERLANGDIRLGGITLHRATRELSFPAKIQLGTGVVEVLIGKSPEGRLYEALLSTDVRPFHLQTLLILLGAKNGVRMPGGAPQGDLVDVDVEYTAQNGKTIREPIENWILDKRTNAPMKRIGWVFTGTTFQDGVPQADVEGNLILTWSYGATVLDIPDPDGETADLFVINEQHPEPPVGTAVRVILTLRSGKP